MSDCCANMQREWIRTQFLGGMIAETNRYVEEVWEDRCTACGTVHEERREKLAAALGSLIMSPAVHSTYQVNRPGVPRN